MDSEVVCSVVSVAYLDIWSTSQLQSYGSALEVNAKRSQIIAGISRAISRPFKEFLFIYFLRDLK